MKGIDLITATVKQMEDWILSQTGQDARLLFADDHLNDPPMYAAELENFISDALADHFDAGGEID